jgi:hypothetical protein
MTFARVVLGLSVLTYAGFGAAFLIAPVTMAAYVEIELPAPSAVVDVRATYGGFELGLAAFLAWCLAAPERVRTGLLASALTIAGFGVTRLMGIAIDGTVNHAIYIALALEWTGIAATSAALWQLASKETLT